MHLLFEAFVRLGGSSGPDASTLLAWGQRTQLKERKQSVSENARNSGSGVRTYINTFEGEKRAGIMISTRGEQIIPTERVIKVSTRSFHIIMQLPWLHSRSQHWARQETPHSPPWHPWDPHQEGIHQLSTVFHLRRTPLKCSKYSFAGGDSLTRNNSSKTLSDFRVACVQRMGDGARNAQRSNDMGGGEYSEITKTSRTQRLSCPP